MDGTLIDNTPYHYLAWQQLFKQYNMPELSKETYLSNISGVPILNTLKRYFGEDTNEDKLEQLVKEKPIIARSRHFDKLETICRRVLIKFYCNGPARKIAG